jgi:hypothetical protein
MREKAGNPVMWTMRPMCPPIFNGRQLIPRSSDRRNPGNPQGLSSTGQFVPVAKPIIKPQSKPDPL